MKLSTTCKRILAHLKDTGPATKLELADACFASPSTICVCLRTMRNGEKKMIYKQSWRKSYVRGNGGVAPLYALGDKDDVPPPPGTNATHRSSKYRTKVRDLLGVELARKVIYSRNGRGSEVISMGGVGCIGAARALIQQQYRLREHDENTFKEQYKHPNWQKRRLEMLERAHFACSVCEDTETTLHVHHKQYFTGRKPWEYSDDELVVLCEYCHAEAHANMDALKSVLATIDPAQAGEITSLIAGYCGGNLHASGDIEAWIAGGIAATLAGGGLNMNRIIDLGEQVKKCKGVDGVVHVEFKTPKRFL